MPTLQQVFDCDDPVALVTGSGAKRVGREIALRLAKLGCRCALHANTSRVAVDELKQLITQDIGRESFVTHGSLAEEGTPDRLVKETVERFGRLDILVNSAAIWTPTPLEDITPAEIRNYFEINSVASFLA